MTSTTKSRNWILKGKTTNPELQNLTNLGPHTFNCCSFGSVPCKGTCPKATFSDHQNLEHHTLKWMHLGITQIFRFSSNFTKSVLALNLEKPWKKFKHVDFFTDALIFSAWLLKFKIVRYLKIWCPGYVMDSWKFHAFFWQIRVS